MQAIKEEQKTVEKYFPLVKGMHRFIPIILIISSLSELQLLPDLVANYLGWSSQQIIFFHPEFNK